jgi:hypothetical protein
MRDTLRSSLHADHFTHEFTSQRICVFVWCFTSRSIIFHLYGDVTIADEGLQNLVPCSALRAFEQGGSLSCHTCCDTGPRFFRSHPKDCTIQSPFTTRMGMRRTYSNPGPHGNTTENVFVSSLMFINSFPIKLFISYSLKCKNGVGSFKNLLLQSHWQSTLIYIILGWRNCSNKGPGPFQIGGNLLKNAKMELDHLKIFFSRTAEPE